MSIILNINITGLGITMAILAMFIILVLVMLFLFNRYKKLVALRKVTSLEEQLDKYSKENNDFKNKLNELVEKKAGGLYDELLHQERKSIESNIELKKEKENSYLKNAYLAKLSHEIRTPLNSIIGFTDLLQAEMESLEKDELVNFTQIISNSSNKLLTLLENLIDISRVDANEYTTQSSNTNIETVLNGVRDEFLDIANNKNIELKIIADKIPDCRLDIAIMQKVLELIMHNAIKFTAKGHIHLIANLEDNNTKLSINIVDSGVGIDKAFLKDIFNPFRQESLGYKSTREGSGLSLPLAKKLCELIHGDIDIDSEIGRGTSVKISIPFKTKQTLKNTDDQNKEDKYKSVFKSIHNPRIFIVEDDKMNRMIFTKMLHKFSFLTICEDGDIALQTMEKAILENKTFDIILMDINLPGQWDGIKLMKEMKDKFKEVKTIPFVAQTAYAMSGNKEDLLYQGFDDYISKPIDRSELYHIIGNNIKLKNNLALDNKGGN